MTEPSTTQRDELALDIFLADNARQPEAEALVDWETALHITAGITYAHGIADGLIAKGYSKPRTITTVEELDALPRGSVVACISHILNLPVTFVFQRGSHNAMGYGWTTPDTPGQIESADVFEFVALNGYLTIFTVLVEPDFGAAA